MRYIDAFMLKGKLTRKGYIARVMHTADPEDFTISVEINQERIANLISMVRYSFSFKALPNNKVSIIESKQILLQKAQANRVVETSKRLTKF